MDQEGKLKKAMEMSDMIKKCCEQADIKYIRDDIGNEYISVGTMTMDADYTKFYQNDEPVVTLRMFRPRYETDISFISPEKTLFDITNAGKKLSYYDDLECGREIDTGYGDEYDEHPSRSRSRRNDWYAQE